MEEQPDVAPASSTAALMRTWGGDPPLFSTASQNVMAAALLLRPMSEPSTPEGRRVHEGLHGLLEHAMVQNTESSASRHQDSWAEQPRNQPRTERAASVHPEPAKP